MIIDCIDEAGLLKPVTLDKIKQASSQVFRQEFRLEPSQENRLEVSLTITDEETIQQINREYRNIDRVTDVLSFPQYADAEDVEKELEQLDSEISLLLGDVVICYKRACEQAVEYENSEEREITYLFVHSMMHLLGYDHMEEEERQEMRIHEEQVMTAIDLARA